MKSILALVLLGVAIIHLSGATEEETDKQVAQQENQLDLSQVQELAEPDAKKRTRNVRKKKKSGNGKNKKCTKARRKRGKCGKGRRAKNRRGKAEGKGKGKAKRRQRKKAKRTKKAKRAKKAKKRSQRKRQKNQRRRNRRLRSRQGNSTGTGGAAAGGCETGCSTIMVAAMKAARKQNTYLKQFNRIVNGQKQAKKKGLKKSDFDSNATDGPLALLLEAGGGNKSDLSCAGSKDNKAAKLMANLTSQLDACQTDIADKCNNTKMVKLKDTWVACNKSMHAFKTASDACLKEGGAKACTCFNATATMKLMKEVENCSAEEMLKASTADKKLLKGCKDAYGKCRKGGESIRPVLSACQAGGRTEAQTKKDVGNVLKNEAANKAITEKVAALVKSASGRKSMNRREVTFDGTTYKLTTCGEWADAGTAWVTVLEGDVITDISAAGNTIAGTTVTCSASDLTKLNALDAKAKAVAKKVAKKKMQLQKQLEKLSGSTISSADALSAAGGGAGAATGAGRRRHKILAEFRQRF